MKRLIRSKWLKIMVSVLAVIGLILLAYAYFVEPDRLVVRFDTVSIKGWNPAFDGLKIAVLGDIHGGSNSITEERLREIVARTNEQEPDVIVLLGDYVAHPSPFNPFAEKTVLMPASTVFQNLAGLRAKYGVYAVLGNHDGWYGDGLVAGEATRQGYVVLQNRAISLEKDGQHLRILGLRDHLSLPSSWARVASDAKKALEGTGDGDLIVLEHSPDVLPAITDERLISPDLKLFLAAHTHGGQVRLPLIGSPIIPSSYGQRYARGHVYDHDVDMYVTSGIGTSVLPIRFMVPPEIVILTIRSG